MPMVTRMQVKIPYSDVVDVTIEGAPNRRWMSQEDAARLFIDLGNALSKLGLAAPITPESHPALREYMKPEEAQGVQ